MLKTTKLKCSCGAEFEMSEEDPSYIDPSNGKLDSKGRMFIYQVRADEWLNRHSRCIDAYISYPILKANVERNPIEDLEV